MFFFRDCHPTDYLCWTVTMAHAMCSISSSVYTMVVTLKTNRQKWKSTGKTDESDWKNAMKKTIGNARNLWIAMLFASFLFFKFSYSNAAKKQNTKKFINVILNDLSLAFQIVSFNCIGDKN
jgi:hypothetical protein